MSMDHLPRLRSLLEAFPSSWAYSSERYVYDPSSHVYDWARIEQEVGVRSLPQDYKRLMEAYGPEAFGGIFVVKPEEIVADQEMFATSVYDFWTDDDLEGARPLHPEPGGLLLCATTEGREQLWWDTSQPDPDRWTIVWGLAFKRDMHTFGGTLTELLIAEFTGELEPRLTAFTVRK